MAAPHTYISSVDYINNLVFDHIETYSFRRGKEYEDNLKKEEAVYDVLKVRKERKNDLSIDEEQRYNELHNLFGFTQYLFNDKGVLQPSSKKTHTFYHNDPCIETIKSVLKTDIVNVPAWMCAPEYRDAIVFYNSSGAIVSTLNICLSCQYMETKMFHHVNADANTYELLREFFIELGHHVESSD